MGQCRMYPYGQCCYHDDTLSVVVRCPMLCPGADAPIAALQACLAKGGFAQLQGLNLSGCGLSFDQLKSLMQQLTANSSAGGQGLAAALKTLEVGANPGTQHDDFE